MFDVPASSDGPRLAVAGGEGDTMAAKSLSATQDPSDFDERAGELHDEIRRLHAVVVAANAIMTRAQVTPRGVEVARVLCVMAESLATEALDLSDELRGSGREAD
jgi:hypothetical protein